MSQAFGECLGLWAAVVWQSMGAPSPVHLVEFGPGRGTLMADALRGVADVMPAFRAALRVHLIEASPALRAVQAQTLGGGVAEWHDGLETLPPGPAILLGNEFLDALPIRQFVRRDAGWAERFVRDGAFVEHPAPDALPLPADAPEGAVQEWGEAAEGFIRSLAGRLAAQNGAALFLDYGPADSGLGDSLQALSAHGAADPLAEPGSVDVTAHVDFAALARAAQARGAAAHGPVPQGIFLQSLGLVTRAAMLARAAPQSAGLQLSAAQRLIAPEGMGRLFKALALAHPALPAPPGFEVPTA
jgi:SAM-dependent MidA family methyltransferase